MSDKQQVQLKAQDIAVAIALLLHGRKKWSYLWLPKYLEISKSTCFASVRNLSYANLLSSDKSSLIIENLKEVIFHGVKFFFPVRPGIIARGVPALSSAPALSKEMNSNETFVWPYDKGGSRGQSIIPLYVSIPQISLREAKLYEAFTFVDCLRCGNARERQFAIDYFNFLFKEYGKL